MENTNIAPLNLQTFDYLINVLMPQAIYNVSKIIDFSTNTRFMPNDPNLSMYTDDVELGGSNHITDDIYYTLHPENIRTIVQKKTHRDDVILNALTRSSQIMNILSPSIPGQKMKKYDETRIFKQSLKDHSPNGHTVTAFDLETISGKDANGIDRLYGIYDYAFINVDNTGLKQDIKAGPLVTKYRGLIGIQDNRIKEKMNSIIEALETGKSLTHEQSLAYEYISRLGASLDRIQIKNGRFISTGLTTSTGFKTLENFKAGYEKLLEIGEKQGSYTLKSGSTLHAGYKQLLDDIKTSIDSNTIIMGHNIKRFDIPVLLSIENMVPGAREYAQSIGLNLKTTFTNYKNVYDTYEEINNTATADPRFHQDLMNQIFANGVPKDVANLTSQKLEVLHKANMPPGVTDAAIQHNAYGDTMKNLQLAGFLPYDEETGAYGRVDIYGQIDNKMAELYQSNDELNNMLEDIFNKPVTMQALRNGGQYSDGSRAGMFGIVMRSDEMFLSNGYRLNYNGNNTLTVGGQKDRYAPGLFKQNAFYNLDSISVLDPTNNADSQLIQMARDFKWHFNADERIYALTLSSTAQERGINRAQNRSIIFVPESELETTLSENFAVVKIGDQVTPAGQKIAASAFSVTAQNGKEIVTDNYSIDTLINKSSDRIEDEIKENASRSLQEGKYSNLIRGYNIQRAYEIAKQGHGQLTLDEFTDAIRNIRKDPSKFIAISSGLSDTTRKEATKLLGNDYFSTEYWNKAFFINGTFNPGWQDNVLSIAKNVNANSPIMKMALYVNQLQDKNIDKNELFGTSMANLIRDGLSKAKTSEELRRIAGVRNGTINYGADVLDVYMPELFRANSKTSDGYFRINLNNPYSFMKSLTDLRSDRNKLILGKHSSQLAILSDFITRFQKSEIMKMDRHDERYYDLLDIKENIEDIRLSLASPNAENQLIDNYVNNFFGQVRQLKQLYESGNNPQYGRTTRGIKPDATHILLDSSYFTEADNSIDVADFVERQRAILKSTSLTSDAETLANYLSGGESLLQDYRQQIADIRNIDPRSYEQRLMLFKKQQDALKTYSYGLIDNLRKNGGTFVINRENGTMKIRFGSEDFDVTNLIPKLEANSGVTYHRLGQSSWATEMVAYDFTNGRLRVSTALDQQSRRIFGSATRNGIIQDSIDRGRRTGAYSTGSSFIFGLKQAADKLRSSEPLAATLQKDARRNTLVSMRDLLTNARYRDKFIQAILPYQKTSSNVQELLEYFRPYTGRDIEYLSMEAQNAFRGLFLDGVLSGSFELTTDDPTINKTITFDMNSMIKDSMEQDLKWSSSATIYNGSIFDNPGRGITHVEESTIQFNAQSLNERSQKLLGRNFDEEIIDAGNGKQITTKAVGLTTGMESVFNNGLTTNRIALRRAEINTRSRDAIVSLFKAHDKNLKILQKMNLKTQVLEGGGYLGANIVRALGYVPGTRILPISMRDIEDIDSDAFKIDVVKSFDADNNPIFRLHYGQGRIVNQYANIVNSYSSYSDANEDLRAERNSIATKELFTRNGNTRLTADQATDMIYSEAKRRGIRIDERTFKQLYNELFDEKIATTPIAIEGPIKGLSGNLEKHEMQTYIGTLRDVMDLDNVDESVKNIIGGEEFETFWQNVSRRFGYNYDIRDVALNEDLYRDIVSGQFNSVLFKDYSPDVLNKIRQAAQGAEGWSSALEEARSYADKFYRSLFDNADYLVAEGVTKYKHETNSSPILDTYKNLRNLFLAQGKSEAQASKEAGSIVNGFIVAKDNKHRVSVNTAGDLVLPYTTNLAIDKSKFKEVQEKYGLNALTGTRIITDKSTKAINYTSALDPQTKINAVIYNDTLAIVSDAANINKWSKFGQREINSLLTTVYDENALEVVRRNMNNIDKFTSIFGEISDLKTKQGIAVWKDAVNAILSDSFGIREYRDENGTIRVEKLFDPNNIEPELREAYTDTYNQLRERWKQKLGTTNPFIGEDTVRNFYEYTSASMALDAMRPNGQIDSRQIAGRFTNKVNIEDIYLSIGHDADFGSASSNNIWMRDTIVNLVDDDLGITEDFLQRYGHTGTIYVPGSAPQRFHSSPGSLKEYQRIVSKISTDYSSLRALQNKTDRESIEEADRLRQRIGQNLTAYKQALNEYVNKSDKETGGLFGLLDKRYFGSAQGKLNVYDVASFDSEDVDTIRSLMYDGDTLQNAYKRGQAVSFMVASTKDLDKFGYDNAYFERIVRQADNTLEGENLKNAVNQFRQQWLDEVRTKGIKAIGNRAPADYQGSVRGVQLYFSDELSSGMMYMDSITAALMKGDSDGDVVRAMTLGTRLRSGQFIDEVAANLILNNRFKNSKLAGEIQQNQNLITVRRAFDQAMTINSYTTNAEVYNRLMSDSPSTTTVLEFTTQQRDALTKMFNKRAVDNYVFAQSITYLGKNDAEKAFKNFNSATQIFESALSNLASDSDIVTKWNATASDAGRFVVMQQYLNGEFKSSLSLTKEQRSALVAGTRGYQKVMDTMASHVIKGTRSGAGEIDTAFFVADSLLTQITSDETIDASLRFTQEQINQINLVRMSAKEGFLSPKHAAVESTSKGYQNFVKNVNEAFNMLLNANADHDKAEQMLIENITTFGRTMEQQTSLDILKDKFDNAGNIIGHTADVDKEKFRAHITAGVRQIRSIFENLNDDIRTNIGTLKSQMMASGIDQATRLANTGAVTPASLTAAGVSELLDMDGTTEALFKSQQQNAAFFASATDAANSVQQTVNRSKQAAAKIINPNLPRKLTSLPKNWTSLGLGLAAGLMFAGYAGGNPSEPVGTEAQPRQGEEQSQQIQQMPRLTDSALSSMRGGPKQGYIININAQTKDDTEYASRLISQAVRDNFSNTQINISMNVNQTQTSMDGNDLYEYLANSL